MNNVTAFGSIVRAWRKRRHLTQDAVARKLGIHRHTIGNWEQGDYLPESKAMVLELAKHLHLNDQETRQLLEASLTAISPHWLVPFPRNPFFTGREEILEALHQQLNVKQAVTLTQSYALHGLGGIGKTQIALEYAYRYALEYSAVFWIGAEMSENIIASLLHIAEVLQLPERADKDQQRVVAAVQRWLTTHSQWLLIWDNVEDLALLERFLPSNRQGAILITTRRQALGTLAQGIDLSPMEQEEGTLFLLRRAKILESEGTSEQVRQLATQMPSQYAAAAELVTAMGGLPLALDQTGAYIEETTCGLPAYLELFRTQHVTLLQQRGEGSRHHPESVATTFSIAISATAERHPAVWDLLRVCVLLQPDAIPEEVFRQGAEHLGALLETVCHDILNWNQVVAAACSYSLLYRQPEEQTLSLHRLVQAVLLDAMTEAEQEQWQQRAISALDAVFPEVVPATEYTAWKQCERLLPHALLCLNQSRTSEEFLALASLAYKVALYLRERGQYEQAEPFFQRAVHVREQILGRDHVEVASPLNYLGVLYWEQGRYAQAKPLFQRALSIWEHSLSSEHPLVARALTNLANLSGIQGKYHEAEPLLQRALQIREQALGSHHPLVATSLNNLANIYMEQGKYPQAERLYQHVFRIHEQTLGSDHPLTAFSLGNLAELYQRMGKYREAEPFGQRALFIREQALGSDHPLVAISLNNLAELYTHQGKYTEAEALHQRALFIREQALGSNHPFVAISLAGLARLSHEQGDYTQAKLLFQRALQINEQSQGSDHSDVATLLNGLANVSRDQDKYAEAEPLYRHALSIREQHLGQHHPETAQTLHDLAIFHQKQRNLNEALSLAKRALEIRLQALGATHPETIVTQALSTQLVQEQACTEKTASSQEHAEETPDGLRKEGVLGRTSAAARETANASSSENDHFQQFIAACCELHPHAWCRSADLWKAYTCWVAEQHERFPLSRGGFIAQLKAHGCCAGRTKAARTWRGITLMNKNGDA